MKKQLILFCLCLLPLWAAAQGHTGKVEDCAPMKEGKVCYTDEVEVEDKSRTELFEAISRWAKKSYGKDYFLSNVVTNKSKGTVSVNSKVELLLNETDKTLVKYKMRITCADGGYTVEVSHIVYQYDPENTKKYKTYPAENVIAKNGKSNTVALIKDPLLFCNATFFFVENLFADVYAAADED